MRCAIIAALIILAAPLSLTAGVVHTVSGERHEGELTSISADGQVLLQQGDDSLTIPLADVFRIDLSRGPATAYAEAFTAEVRTVCGSRFYGELLEHEDGIGLKSSVFRDTISFDMENVIAVRFRWTDEHWLTDERLQDTLDQADRHTDALYVVTPRGVIPFSVAIEQIGTERTSFTRRDERREIETGAVSAVVFATQELADRPPVEIVLEDGSVLRCTIAEMDNGEFELYAAGAKLAVELSRVTFIEIDNPGVVYLSDLRPADVREVPFFSHVWEHRIDRSVTGGPLLLDGRRYARGLGCHTRTILTYDLGGRYRTFTAVLGIDDAARPLGSVQFVVRADGEELFSRVITGNDEAVPVTLDISGVDRLTLIADFADNASVGDHANWADARLMK